MTRVLNLQPKLHGGETALLNRDGCRYAEDVRRICACRVQNIADSLAI